MKNCNKYQEFRQTSVPSEASSVKSQITVQSYFTVSPKQRNQIIRSSFKVYQEMKEEMQQNQSSRLSLRFEQIHLLMGAQKLFLHAKKIQEQHNKKVKQEAFQQIVRLGAVDYSCSSIFKTPQRSHSPGIVSKDVGMEKNIQNQQLIKIIQELQTTIAGKELFRTIEQFQQKTLKQGFCEIRYIAKLSIKLERIFFIFQAYQKRQAFLVLKERKNKINKFEPALMMLQLKVEKIKMNYQYFFLYKLRFEQIRQSLITKSQLQIKLNGISMGNNVAYLKFYQIMIKYCYRNCFDQLKRNLYAQKDGNTRNSVSTQKLFSLGQLSQTVSQQVSQVLEPPTYEEELEQLSSQQAPVRPKNDMKQSGKIQQSIKQYITKYEESQQQAQQSKLESMARNHQKVVELDTEKVVETSKLKYKLPLVSIVLILIVLVSIYFLY